MSSPLQTLFASPALADLDRRGLVWAGLISISISLLLFALPLYSLQVFDRVLTTRSSDTLWLLTAIASIALLSSAVLDALRSRILLRVGNGYVLKIAPRLFEGAVVESSKGLEPYGQPLRDVQIIRGFLTGTHGLTAMLDAPLAPLLLIVVYMINKDLGHALLFGITTLFCLTLIGEVSTAKDLRAAALRTTSAQSFSEKIFTNAEVVVAMGMHEAVRKQWQDRQNDALVSGSKASDRVSTLTSVAKWIRWTLSLMITGFGAWLAIHDEVTVGGMVAANILAARSLVPLETLIGSWRNIVLTRAAISRINTFLCKWIPPSSAMQLPAPIGAVMVERLVFVPNGAEHPTIKGISFQVAAGTFFGLVGPSGAGKSTIGKLICGIWEPQAGAIRLDGADIRQWERGEWGKHCGYLPQNVDFLPGSVRDNIARFQQVPDSEIVAAALLAGVHEMILRLPAGYNTLIGTGGFVLSGGQYQRLGLARALFGRPKLVVLDEPNSNLDAEGEAALINAVRQIKKSGSTVFMISHRPSLLSETDLIGVLIEGRLQHIGAPQEVLPKIVMSSQPVTGANRAAA